MEGGEGGWVGWDGWKDGERKQKGKGRGREKKGIEGGERESDTGTLIDMLQSH